MFFKSLCLPFKILEIFFLVYFGVFWPEKCMFKVFDQISDVRGLDGAGFIYGAIVLPTLYCNLWSLTQWKVQKKL